MSSSEMQRVGGAPLLELFRRGREDRLKWESENPEISAAWDEARAEEGRRQYARELAQREGNNDRRAEQEMRRMGFPLDAIDWSARATGAQVEAARKFVSLPAADARFFLLVGPKGTGKTTAAALAVRLILRRMPWNEQPSGNESRQRTSGEFVLASTFARLSGYNAADREWFERCCSTLVLVLDDVGAEAQNEFSASMLDECLTRRHANRLRTVITSNLDAKALRARLGDRLSDRIGESCVVAKCAGESLRKPRKP